MEPTVGSNQKDQIENSDFPDIIAERKRRILERNRIVLLALILLILLFYGISMVQMYRGAHQNHEFSCSCPNGTENKIKGRMS